MIVISQGGHFVEEAKSVRIRPEEEAYYYATGQIAKEPVYNIYTEHGIIAKYNTLEKAQEVLNEVANRFIDSKIDEMLSKSYLDSYAKQAHKGDESNGEEINRGIKEIRERLKMDIYQFPEDDS